MKFKRITLAILALPLWLNAQTDQEALHTCQPLLHSNNYQRCLETYEHIKTKNTAAQKQFETARQKAMASPSKQQDAPAQPTSKAPAQTSKPSTATSSQHKSHPTAKTISPAQSHDLDRNETNQAPPSSQGGFHIDYD